MVKPSWFLHQTYNDISSLFLLTIIQKANFPTNSKIPPLRTPDTKNLFLPISDQNLLASNTEPLIIPCRVADLRTKVSLMIEYNTLVELDGVTVIYHPSVGFNVTANQEQFHGFVFCEGHLGRVQQQQMFTVTYEGLFSPT